jgi:hypothetical protein
MRKVLSMFIRICCAAVVALSASAGASPGQSPAPAAQRDSMKKLDFLVGEWKGEGWMEFVPDQRQTFKGTEIVQPKLDGLLLAIEGQHRGKIGGKGEEVVIHSAFALVSYDDKAKRYRFQAFTGRGNHEDTEAKVTDKQLIWGMSIPEFGDVRYTIKLDEKGRWFEVGEVSKDGKEWRKFFEMTLERVKPK